MCNNEYHYQQHVRFVAAVRSDGERLHGAPVRTDRERLHGAPVRSDGERLHGAGFVVAV